VNLELLGQTLQSLLGSLQATLLGLLAWASVTYAPERIQAGLATFQAKSLVFPILFGFGLYLVLTAQPKGRPKPDLAERLRRLDVDERIRSQSTLREVRPMFASRLLEAMLRPVLDDVGTLIHAVLSRFGLAGGEDLRRKLEIVRPDVTVPQYFGEKLASGLVTLATFPVMNWLGVHPFGVWPLWVLPFGFLVGFLGPDWYLEAQISWRKTLCLMELPTILDMLTIAVSAGLALEQALVVVSRGSGGLIARELQLVNREMALGQWSLVEALERMAERSAIPELSAFASQVRATSEQGLSISHTLETQADAIRDRKLLRIVEEGGKSTVKMILPVAIFVLPVLFVVLLVPAAVELVHLGG